MEIDVSLSCLTPFSININFITLVCEHKAFIPFNPRDTEMDAKKFT